MTIDVAAAEKVLAGLRPFPVAVTTIDLARATVSLTKYNKTNDAGRLRTAATTRS
jgi:hypothetical protein